MYFYAVYIPASANGCQLIVLHAPLSMIDQMKVIVN